MNNVFGSLQPVFEWITNLAALNITWLVFIFPIAYLSLLLVVLFVSISYLPFLIILFTGLIISILGFYGYQKVFTTILSAQK